MSTNGGREPLWAPDGRELFYFNLLPDSEGHRTLMVVDVNLQAAVELGSPRELIRGPFAGGNPLRGYTISGDGNRFLMVERIPRPSSAPVTHLRMVQDWTEELNTRVPVN